MIDQAIVLAAGFGKRLQPLTHTIPKPLVPIGNTTCLDQTIQRLHRHGVKKIIVNTHHLATHIHDHLRSYPDIHHSFEPKVLETGGGIANVLSFFGDQPFFSINGDVWWWEREMSVLQRLENSWDADLMDILLLLVPKTNTIGYNKTGDYHKDLNHRLQKSISLEPAPYVYSGIQVLSSAVFKKSNVWPEQTVFSMTQIFAEAENRQRLYGIEHDDLWADIGSPEGLEMTRAMVIGNEVLP